MEIHTSLVDLSVHSNNALLSTNVPILPDIYPNLESLHVSRNSIVFVFIQTHCRIIINLDR
jgi:hypothetical protein